MNRSRLLRALVPCVCALLVLALWWADRSTAELPPIVELIRFQGRVYITDTTNPLTGATVQLSTSVTGRNAFTVVDTTTTDGDGYFGFARAYAVRTDYRIQETNLPLYGSTGGVAPGGTVIDSDTVQYTYPARGTYGDIRFYTRSTSSCGPPARRRV